VSRLQQELFVTPVMLPTKTHGDAVATAQRITGSEGLFRLGIASELLSVIAFLFLGCALYRVFREVDKGYAFPMVMLVAASVPLSFANVWNETAVLTLLQPTGFLSAAPLQRESLAMMSPVRQMPPIQLCRRQTHADMFCQTVHCSTLGRCPSRPELARHLRCAGLYLAVQICTATARSPQPAFAPSCSSSSTSPIFYHAAWFSIEISGLSAS